MAEVNNCILPDELQYHVEFNVWLRDNGDGTFDMGMTDIAQTMAGSVIHCRAKAVGKTVKKGKSIATVESGKWVGPVKTPLTAEIMACNQDVESDAVYVLFKLVCQLGLKSTAGLIGHAGANDLYIFCASTVVPLIG